MTIIPERDGREASIKRIAREVARALAKENKRAVKGDKAAPASPKPSERA